MNDRYGCKLGRIRKDYDHEMSEPMDADTGDHCAMEDTHSASKWTEINIGVFAHGGRPADPSAAGSPDRPNSGSNGRSAGS